MMFCPNCNTKITLENAKFCHNCATDLRSLRATASTDIGGDNVGRDKIGGDHTDVDNIENSKNVAIGRENQVSEFSGERQGGTYNEYVLPKEVFPSRRGCYADIRNLSFAVVAGTFILIVLVWSGIIGDEPTYSPSGPLSGIKERLERLFAADTPVPTVGSIPTPMITDVLTSSQTSTNALTPAYTRTPAATPNPLPIPEANIATQSYTIGPISNIYRIKSDGCSSEPKSRRLTGFRIQGTVGIVTALHGVVDCQTFSAVGEDGEVFNDLAIGKANIEHDTALLNSAQLEALPAEGLKPSTLSDSEILTASLRIVGYPLAAEKQNVDVITSVRAISSLDDTIPNAEESADFIARKSPELDITVLNLQAQLLPGHSGAPILDAENRVVAVGNGGLRGGIVGLSWAIPWPITLQEATLSTIKTKLSALAGQDYAALAFSSTYPVAAGALETTRQVGTVIGINGQPLSGAEVSLILTDAYYIAYTDNEGKYSFFLAPDAAERFIELRVEKDDYQTRRLTGFTQLPWEVKLNVIRSALPVLFDAGDYVQVIWSSVKLYMSPREGSPLVTELSEGSVLQVSGGPQAQGGLIWWPVRVVDDNGQTGWIVAASATEVFVKLLP